jgi:hypothetical protein
MSHRKAPVGLVTLVFLLVSAHEVSARASALDTVQLLAPGLTAQLICTEPCPDIVLSPSGDIVAFPGLQLAGGQGMDVLGAIYFRDEPTLYCTPERSATTSRMFRTRFDGTGELLVVFPGRCLETTYEQYSIHIMTLDSISGRAVLYVKTWIRLLSTSDAIDSFAEVIEISGLPTLLDIILSYQPPSTLSFNVPVRPEGLAGADSFSVYAGDLDTVSDLSQAVPLQCTVPDGRPPVPGE